MQLYTIIYNMNHRPTTFKDVATVDYNREQIRRELNSLRRNVHDLCTRSMTGFDCDRFLNVADKSSTDGVLVKTTKTDHHSNAICDLV